MGLKVLCAGCSKDERSNAEAAVRQALADRAENGAWTVSLVKAAEQWSVTVDAPSHGLRSLTLVAPLRGLRESLTEALRGGGDAPPPVQARTAGSRSPCRCEKCGKAFVVSYEAMPDESEESVAVACPHCWQVNRVLVAESAAEAMDYRAEKA
jgi:hypothetical protein